MQPEQIGPYSIVRLLSEGGMGAVYEAIQHPIERRVALKVLLPHHAKSQDALQRFFNEARAVNLIEHPSIVQISDYGQAADKTAYLVMEYLHGEVLSQRLERTHSMNQRLPLKAAVQIAMQIADALAAAHAKVVIHRDLKPSNIMLVDDTAVAGGVRVKVLDFGIAKLVLGQAKGTETHVVMGTPQYMSPEQCRGAGGVDERTDVYSLGIILYEMLAGRPPFVADSPIEYMGQHVFGAAPALSDYAPTVPSELVALTHRLLIKDKEQRPTMRQVHAQLSQILSLVSDTAQPIVPHNEVKLVSAQTAVSHRRLSALWLALHGRVFPPVQGKWVRRAAALVGLTILALSVGRWLYHARRVPAHPARVASLTAPSLSPAVGRPGPEPAEPPTAGVTPPTSPPAALPPAPPVAPGEAPIADIQAAPAGLETKAIGHGEVRGANPKNVAFSTAAALEAKRSQLDIAQNEYTRGNYQKVISIASPIIKYYPSRAWRLIGLAACNLKDLTQAGEAYRHLDAAAKKYMVLVCLRNSVQENYGVFKTAPSPQK